MLDRVDQLFLQPRLVLDAKRVEVYDAINMVVYAKIPLVSARRGKALIAGFVSLDNNRQPSRMLSQRDVGALSSNYGRYIDRLSYPVAPSQYEPLLEKMVEAKETVLPYFYHEHHFLVDRKLRAELFLKLLEGLRRLVGEDKIILQTSDSERTSMVVSHAWMTAESLSKYLSTNGVAPWWGDEENIQSHAKLERILPSDGMKHNRAEPLGIDYDQLPSFLFAGMLLRHGANPFRHATQVGSPNPLVSPPTSEPASSSQYGGVIEKLEQQNHLKIEVQTRRTHDPAPAERGESIDLVALLVQEVKNRQANHGEQGEQGEQDQQGDVGDQRAQDDLADVAAGKRLPDACLRAQPDFAHEICSDLPSGSSSREMPESNAVPLGPQPQRVALPKGDVPDAGATKIGGLAGRAPLMTKKEVAEFLNVSINTVDNYRKLPDFPTESKLVANTLRWERDEIVAWQNCRKRIRSEGAE